MTDNRTIQMALGRIFLLGSRPEQSGDVAVYERCRRLILDHHYDEQNQGVDFGFAVASHERAHDYARDRLKGAQGDF